MKLGEDGDEKRTLANERQELMEWARCSEIVSARKA